MEAQEAASMGGFIRQYVNGVLVAHRLYAEHASSLIHSRNRLFPIGWKVGRDGMNSEVRVVEECTKWRCAFPSLAQHCTGSCHVSSSLPIG